MKRLLILLAAAALPTAARCAQQTGEPVPEVSVTADNPVPLTTVVPVQQPAVDVTVHALVDDESTKGLDRKQRRELKEKRFAARIDSLVQSRNYVFYPNSMQQAPDGVSELIYAGFYYFGVFTDHVEVHLPTERGISQYIEMLNFDSMSIRDYHAAHTQWGWNVTFGVMDGDSSVCVNLLVSTVTGESVLVLMTPTITMKYVGYLWWQRDDGPKLDRYR